MASTNRFNKSFEDLHETRLQNPADWYLLCIIQPVHYSNGCWMVLVTPSFSAAPDLAPRVEDLKVRGKQLGMESKVWVVHHLLSSI